MIFQWDINNLHSIFQIFELEVSQTSPVFYTVIRKMQRYIFSMFREFIATSNTYTMYSLEALEHSHIDMFMFLKGIDLLADPNDRHYKCNCKEKDLWNINLSVKDFQQSGAMILDILTKMRMELTGKDIYLFLLIESYFSLLQSIIFSRLNFPLNILEYIQAPINNAVYLKYNSAKPNVLSLFDYHTKILKRIRETYPNNKSRLIKFTEGLVYYIEDLKIYDVFIHYFFNLIALRINIINVEAANEKFDLDLKSLSSEFWDLDGKWSASFYKFKSFLSHLTSPINSVNDDWLDT
jgi:hypothetical protein